ncbi:MAG: 3'(2'),5'-bisphosphate nucleotidase CysQ [Rhodobiaceae bacterium]|nr:3'(2'),5'-bisphosphate nucleotidase CysQ [Rhodobiaceae bacterium]
MEALCRIAVQAGAAIMDHYVTDIVVNEKDDKTPVTAADQDAEDIILPALAKAAPGIPIVSEEATAAGAKPEVGPAFFLVDPLDGTREFINKNGEFTVNIALIEEGCPTMGVVYAPAKNRMFYSAGPEKAYEQDIAPDAKGSLEKATKPARLTVRKADPKGMIAVASRSHRDHKTDEYLEMYNIKDFLTAGSSLKFCLIAAGEADIYPRHGRTMEWDTAAGHAVLSGAGGRVDEMDGSPLKYGKLERGLDNPYFVAKGGLA